MSVERFVLNSERDKLFLVGLLDGSDVKMLDSGILARTVGDMIRIFDKMGVQFEFAGSDTLSIKAKDCKDMVLKLSQNKKQNGLYLPFAGLTRPMKKWLRRIEVEEDGNSFQFIFGDHPKNRNGEDTLIYTYEKSFSLKYGAA